MNTYNNGNRFRVGRKNGEQTRAKGFTPYDEETTNVVFRVDDTSMHLSRGTFMQASPELRKMLNSNGKEKQAQITLPEKSYEEVDLFLRCISPREFVKLDGKECHQRVIIV